MTRQIATEEYAKALRAGQKEYRELLMSGKNANPAVLDEILEDVAAETVVDIGLVEIPSERIVGVKSAGRTTAFTATFKPLLDSGSEFGMKWIALCIAHLGDTGITEPILCYEYLGNFYVQEGNKRVSVLRHFDAPRIPGNVKRVMPPMSEEPRIKAYYEFIDFYKVSGLYTVQFRRPGDYAKLLEYLGKKPGEVWTDSERRSFNANFHYFLDAFQASNDRRADVLPEEALLLWLKLYPYTDLGRLSGSELKKSVAALWEDMVSTAKGDALQVQTRVEEEKGSLMTRIISSLEQLNVAFVHQLKPSTSAWVLGHEEGKNHIEAIFLQFHKSVCGYRLDFRNDEIRLLFPDDRLQCISIQH